MTFVIFYYYHFISSYINIYYRILSYYYQNFGFEDFSSCFPEQFSTENVCQINLAVMIRTFTLLSYILISMYRQKLLRIHAPLEWAATNVSMKL